MAVNPTLVDASPKPDGSNPKPYSSSMALKTRYTTRRCSASAPLISPSILLRSNWNRDRGLRMLGRIYRWPTLSQLETVQVCRQIGHFRAAEPRPWNLFQSHAVQHHGPVLPESGHHREGCHSASHSRPVRCAAGRIVMTGAAVL